MLYAGVLEEKATGGKGGQHSHLRRGQIHTHSFYLECMRLQTRPNANVDNPHEDDLGRSFLDNFHHAEPVCVTAGGWELNLISCGCDCRGRSEIYKAASLLVFSGG